MTWRTIILTVCLWLIAHSTTSAKQNQPTNRHFGPIPIGQLISKHKNFIKSNCDIAKSAHNDCTTSDSDGWLYSFYDGKLIRLSLEASKANLSATLPAGMIFGEDVALSAGKAKLTYGIELKPRVTDEGYAVYASEFVVHSVTGWRYSIELIADNKGGLRQIVGRANFP